MTSIDLPAIAGARRLIVVVGPSGAGKDSVLRAWRQAPGAAAPVFAQRVITRAPDDTEAHEAVTGGDFTGLRSRGLLATWCRRTAWTTACAGSNWSRSPTAAGSC
jgi:ribose 1,5-bisphosphokinase